jgi:hypothetical protein
MLSAVVVILLLFLSSIFCHAIATACPAFYCHEYVEWTIKNILVADGNSNKMRGRL